MKSISVFEAIDEVIKITDLNLPSSISAVIGPPQSGKTYIVNYFLNSIKNKARSIFIGLSCREPNDDDNLILKIINLIKDSIGDLNDEIPEHLPFANMLYTFLANNNALASYKIILFIDDFDSITEERQYEIGSQLRNFRETLKASQLEINFHCVVLGNLRYLSILEKCISKAGSFIFDDIIQVDGCKKSEMGILLENAEGEQFKYFDEIVVSMLYEISGGIVGIIFLIIDLMGERIKSEKFLMEAINNIHTTEKFVKIFQRSIEYLNDEHGNILIRLLQTHSFQYAQSSKIIEDLIHRGLVRVNLYLNTVQIRSWIHEQALRNYFGSFLPEANYCEKSTDLIAPVTTINRLAYEIIMQIENMLRNFLINLLSQNKANGHPLMNLDQLGKIKDKGGIENNCTIYEYCFNNKKKTQESKFISNQASLSSFLYLLDIENLFTNNFKNENWDYVGIYDEINVFFPNKEELKKKFEELRDIRNFVAHNYIINYNCIENLNQIRDYFIQSIATGIKII